MRWLAAAEQHAHTTKGTSGESSSTTTTTTTAYTTGGQPFTQPVQPLSKPVKGKPVSSFTVTQPVATQAGTQLYSARFQAGQTQPAWKLKGIQGSGGDFLAQCLCSASTGSKSGKRDYHKHSPGSFWSKCSDWILASGSPKKLHNDRDA